jgi:xanthine/uracil/vitamin C permease (AzgA family)
MTTMAARLEAGWLERKFRFAEHGTTLARDTVAGMTTFVVMSYIIFVNPSILSFSGIEGSRARASRSRPPSRRPASSPA